MPDPEPEPALAELPPLLEVSDLRRHYPVRGQDQLFGRQLVRAVDGVDLRLPAGRSLALIGESGCGKSTLARTVLRLERPTGGRIAFAGTDITRIGGGRLRRLRPRMQLVFQDPASALDPRLTAWDTVAEPLRYHRVGPPAAVHRRVTELLEMVEIAPELAHRRPHEYSGGQQQRIAIARALALSPELLVLDEPLSALDVSVQAGIINMLNRVRAELGLTYLLISHDLSVVQHLCEEVAVMYLGRVVERGPLPEVFGHPRHPYTRALLSAVPDPSREPADGPGGRIVLVGEVPSPTAPPSGCRFRTRCWKAQQVCAEQEPPLLPDPGPRSGSRVVACHFPEPEPADDT
ncbi:MAG: ABC transporter ATP-binding protein [Natronosporangium sp.]